MAKTNHVLFLLDNSFTNDRRVHREAQTLVQSGYEVTLIAVASKELPSEELIDGIRVIRLLNAEIFDIKKWNAHREAAEKIIQLGLNWSVIHAHDHTMLSIGCELKKMKPNSSLIYDSHELFSSWPLNVSNYNSFTILIKSFIVRKIQIWKERRNAKKVDYLITVNESLRSYLSEYFKVKPKKTLAVRNIPEIATDNASTNILRDKFAIPQSHSILVFIGANIYAKTLNLEQVLSEFANTTNVSVVFICSLNENARPIQEMVKTEGWQHVHFHDKIAPAQIAEFLSMADVGLVPTWNKKDLSYWYALDNKLFEYINAGIPVLATIQPEYKLIIDEYHCGICVNPDEENAYVRGFIKIMENIAYYRENIQKTSTILTWEKEQEKLIQFYNAIYHYD